MQSKVIFFLGVTWYLQNAPAEQAACDRCRGLTGLQLEFTLITKEMLCLVLCARVRECDTYAGIT